MRRVGREVRLTWRSITASSWFARPTSTTQGSTQPADPVLRLRARTNEYRAKLLVLPRDANPYQESLYRELRTQGVEVRYLQTLTRSRILSLALLPAETCFWRLRGWRAVHIHWVFGFALPMSGRFRSVRLCSQVWFLVWLRLLRLLRMKLAWTAHNAVPHEPVFASDIRARCSLVKQCRLVLVHSTAAADELAGLGIIPQHLRVVPQGRPGRAAPAESVSGLDDTPTSTRKFLFFGRIRHYKGVDVLLEAFGQLNRDEAATLLVAGSCDDPALRYRLEQLAKDDVRITLRIEHLSTPCLEAFIRWADFIVLPFRHITTTSTATHALSRGKPLIIPALTTLSDLPSDATVRYDGTPSGLRLALEHATGLGDERLATMRSAAHHHTLATPTWATIANLTASCFLDAGLWDAPRQVSPHTSIAFK